MILQALNELYERLADDPAYELPRPGYSTQKVSFCVVLKPDGTLVGIEDVRQERIERTKGGKEKKFHFPRQLALPGGAKPTGKVTANSIGKKAGLFWNDAGYMLGIDIANDGTVSRAPAKLQAFRANHIALSKTLKDEGLQAVCAFLGGSDVVSYDPAPNAIEFLRGFGVFQIVGESAYVHQRVSIKQHIESGTKGPVGKTGVCLVTGKDLPIARLHEPKIKNVAAASPPPGGGALLVAFDKDAFRSYGKEQGGNAPVSESAAFAYTNALNSMLGGRQSHRHRVIIGDATTVFWTEKPAKMESLFAEFIQGNQIAEEETEATQDEGLATRLKVFMEILRQGGGAELGKLGDDPLTKFFILGLSPNASRLSVRFWHVATLGQMVDKLKAHYDALRVRRSSDKDPEFPAAWQLLRQTGRESKDIPPVLAGPLMQAILTGSRYPQGLFSAVLNRIRADRRIDPFGRGETPAETGEIRRAAYLRVCIFKAFLTRNHQQDIPMSLDANRTEPAYLLGRLFAALEKTQEDALPSINATIRDRFYSAVSATPGSVFPRLLRTYQHHLTKAASENGQGYKVNREKLIQEITDKLTGMPAHLALEGQGLFAIGYYHQRQDFFSKKDKPEPTQA